MPKLRQLVTNYNAAPSERAGACMEHLSRKGYVMCYKNSNEAISITKAKALGIDNPFFSFMDPVNSIWKLFNVKLVDYCMEELQIKNVVPCTINEEVFSYNDNSEVTPLNTPESDNIAVEI